MRSALEPPTAFDPATATQNFTIGATDNVDFALAIVVPRLSRAAPHATFSLISLAHSEAAYPLLDNGSLYVAVGLFRAVPKRFNTVSLYWERYVCIVHTANIRTWWMGLPEKFVGLPHLAVTRDVGTVDDALAKQGLERRVAVDVPFYAIVPHMIEGSRLLAVIGERVGHGLTATTNVQMLSLALHGRAVERERGLATARHPADQLAGHRDPTG